MLNIFFLERSFFLKQALFIVFNFINKFFVNIFCVKRMFTQKNLHLDLKKIIENYLNKFKSFKQILLNKNKKPQTILI